VGETSCRDHRNGRPDDRERRQNDTWIAACALSVEPPLPIVTGNLRDFAVLAAASELTLVHPDLTQ
jgi:predicted nucleic acid-binding protein